MNWYISKLVFEIVVACLPHRQCDVQYRLVKARNADEALGIAFEIAQHEEAVFVNAHGQTVSCKFAGVAALHLLDELSHGMLLISESVENCTACDIAAMLKFRAPLVCTDKEEACGV